jgi:hypothetical protein
MRTGNAGASAMTIFADPRRERRKPRSCNMRNHIPYLGSLAGMTLVIGWALSVPAARAADLPVGSYANASVTLTFDDKARFRVNDGKAVQVTGHYTVKGNQLELTDEKGPWACTKAEERTGTYTWKYDNSVLTLAKVADLCGERAVGLTAGDWKKTH